MEMDKYTLERRGDKIKEVLFSLEFIEVPEYLPALYVVVKGTLDLSTVPILWNRLNKRGIIDHEYCYDYNDRIISDNPIQECFDKTNFPNLVYLDYSRADIVSSSAVALSLEVLKTLNAKKSNLIIYGNSKIVKLFNLTKTNAFFNFITPD